MLVGAASWRPLLAGCYPKSAFVYSAEIGECVYLRREDPSDLLRPVFLGRDVFLAVEMESAARKDSLLSTTESPLTLALKQSSKT